MAQFARFLNGQDEPVDSYDGWLDVIANLAGDGDLPIQLALRDGLWRPLPERDNQPIENVTWIGAHDYCAWRDARLPTEAEWEYAARGPDGLFYPWGNEYISANLLLSSSVQMPDVGSIPRGASWVGALDMSGSLYEWTNSLYRPYPYDPNDGREAGLEDDFGNRVFRGSPGIIRKTTCMASGATTSAPQPDMTIDQIWLSGILASGVRVRSILSLFSTPDSGLRQHKTASEPGAIVLYHNN